jgi:hypothetical protein
MDQNGAIIDQNLSPSKNANSLHLLQLNCKTEKLFSVGSVEVAEKTMSEMHFSLRKSENYPTRLYQVMYIDGVCAKTMKLFRI